MTDETEVNVKLNPNHPMVKSALNLALSSDWETQDQAVQIVADMLMATMIFAHITDVGETDNLMGMILAGQKNAERSAHHLLKKMHQGTGL
jgi:hypothetical protein